MRQCVGASLRGAVPCGLGQQGHTAARHRHPLDGAGAGGRARAHTRTAYGKHTRTLLAAAGEDAGRGREVGSGLRECTHGRPVGFVRGDAEGRVEVEPAGGMGPVHDVAWCGLGPGGPGAAAWGEGAARTLASEATRGPRCAAMRGGTEQARDPRHAAPNRGGRARSFLALFWWVSTVRAGSAGNRGALSRRAPGWTSPHPPPPSNVSSMRLGAALGGNPNSASSARYCCDTASSTGYQAGLPSAVPETQGE